MEKIFLVSIVGLFIASLFVTPGLANATTNIDSTNRYAWSENAGWIDFGSSQGNVIIQGASNSGLEFVGYAYSETMGWISLNCKNTDSCATTYYAVVADDYGQTAGYAWSENAGWINFNPANAPQGVKIGTNGDFSGYAYGENTGWIVFNCATTDSCATVNYKVSTSFLPPEKPAGFGGSSGGSVQASFTVPTVSTPVTTPTVTPAQDQAEIDRLQLVLDNLKAQIQALIAKKLPQPTTAPTTPITDMPNLPPQAPTQPVFTQTLKLGSVGNQVTALQNKLKELGLFPSEITANGYFGKVTLKAVQDFQIKNNIVSPEVYGYGIVGPKTREALNNLK